MYTDETNVLELLNEFLNSSIPIKNVDKIIIPMKNLFTLRLFKTFVHLKTKQYKSVKITITGIILINGFIKAILNNRLLKFKTVMLYSDLFI
jgi:hypothetical protein